MGIDLQIKFALITSFLLLMLAVICLPRISYAIGRSEVRQASRRRNIRGWYATGCGIITYAAAALLGPALTDRDLIEAIARLSLSGYETALAPFLNLLPPQLLATARSFLAQHWQTIAQLISPFEHLWPAPVLLAIYIVARATVGWILMWGIAHGGARLLLRPDEGMQDDREVDEKLDTVRPTLIDATERINLDLARSAATHAIGAPVLIGIVSLAIAYVTNGGRDIDGWSIWHRWPSHDLNPLAIQRNLFWLGLFILLCEVFGQAWLLSRLSEEGEKSEQNRREAAPEAQPGLEQLFNRALHELGSRHILFAEQRPVANQANQTIQLEKDQAGQFALRKIAALLERAPGTADHVIKAAFGLIDDFLLEKKGSDLVIDEPLNAAHIRMVFAIAEHVQSQGRTTLIICPESALESVKASLDSASSASFASRVQRPAVLRSSDGKERSTDSALFKDRSYSYILVADTDVEAQLFSSSQSDAVEGILENLGLVVTLETQDLQVSFLRLQLGRLWLRVPREKVRALVHMSHVANSKALAEALFPPIGARSFAQALLKLDLEPALYRLVWHDAPATAQALVAASVEDNFPANALATDIGVRAFAWTANEHTKAVGSGPASNADALQRARDALRGRDARGSKLVLGAAFGRSNSKEARVIVVDDTSSVPAALMRCVTPDIDGELLINVVSRPYPLRDYHVGRLLACKSTSDLARAGIELAPDVKGGGGVRELLATLLVALSVPKTRSGGGLLRSEITDRFISQLPRPIMERIEFLASKSGIETLLAEEFGLKGIDVESTLERGDTRYRIDAGAHGEKLDWARTQVRVPVAKDGVVTSHRLLAGDIGLLYLPHQKILLDGSEHMIEGIDRQFGARHVVRVSSNNDGAGGVGFAKIPVVEYELLSEAGSPWSGGHASTLSSGGGDLRRREPPMRLGVLDELPHG